MSVPANNDFFLDWTAAGVNSNMLNTTNVGNTYSEFDPINGKHIFCWEMCANDLRKSFGENGVSFGVSVKDMDMHTHALYRAQFSLKFENGNGIFHAKIQREENFETIPVNEVSYNFIVDGTPPLYGNLIPFEVVADIISKNRCIKIVADLDGADENTPAIHFAEPVDVEEEDDENDRENYLPNFDDAEHIEHVDLPDIF